MRMRWLSVLAAPATLCVLASASAATPAREVQRLEVQRRAEAQKAASLAAKAQAEAKRAAALADDLNALAAKKAAAETARLQTEASLALLAAEADRNAALYAQHRDHIELLLVGLVRGRGPEAAFPGASAAARAAAQALAGEAADKRGKVEQALAAGREAALRREALGAAAARFEAASVDTQAELDVASRRRDDLSRRAAQAAERSRDLARQARDLKDLAARAALAQKQAQRQAQKQVGAVPRMLAVARGKRLAPAHGVVVAAFGATAKGGQPASGVTLRTAPGAAVVAPANGIISFAGPFRSYGQVLILDAGGGYAVILTGLESVLAETGRNVTAGAVIGRMGGPTAASGAITSPDLYLEVRQAGRPIDPEGWLKAGKG